MLNKITLRKTSQLSEAEILLRDLPLDNPTGHLALISEKIHNGKAQCYEIRKNQIKIGVAIFEIFNHEFWVLGMICNSRLDIFQTCQEIIPPLAKQNGCDEIVFWTMRSGLIENSLRDGFRISHVELRKKI